MKLLIILPRIPYPLEKGDKLRAFYQIKELAEYFEIHLCALYSGKLPEGCWEALSPYCHRIHFIKRSKLTILFNTIKAFFSGTPLQLGYFFSRKAKKKIESVVSETPPDRVYCQLLRVAPYAMHLPYPKIIDYQDVFSKGVERRIDKAGFLKKPVFRMEYKRLLKYENLVFDAFDAKTIISESDRIHIPHPEKDRIHIIPNGVNFDFFSPNGRKDKDIDLLFTGNMGYPPNIDSAVYLAQKIMPILLKKRPGTRLMIAGANPSSRVRSLASENIIVTGWVEDIRDCYERAKVFIAPMQIGTGLQNKLLEAMAMELPCITSPLANKSLGAESGKEILIGLDPEEYADACLKLLEDINYSQSIAAQGKAYVKDQFDWKNMTGLLAEIIKKPSV